MDHPTPNATTPGAPAPAPAAATGGRRRVAVTLLLGLLLGAAVAQGQAEAPSAAVVGSLSQAWEAALSSPAMRRAEAGLQAADERAAAVAAAFDLSLSAGLRAETGAVHPDGADPDRRDPELRLDPITLSLRFDGWPSGPRADEREASALRLSVQRQQLFETAGQTLIDATERYLAALRAEQTAQLRRAQAEAAETAMDAVALRLELGSATERELREAELSLLRAQADLGGAERQAAQAREALQRLLGVAVGELSEPTLLSTEPAWPEDVLTALEARAAMRQARLQLLEAEQAAAATGRSSGPQLSWQLSAAAGDQDRRFDLGLAGSSADPRPRLDLSFAPQTGMTQLQMLGDGRAWQVGAGISLSVPLGPQGGHQREAAALDLLAAELQAAGAVEDLLLELQDRLRATQNAEAQLRLAEAVLAARLADTEEDRQRLDLGLTTATELEQGRLNADAALLDLQRAADGLLLAHMRLALALAIDPLEVLR